MTLPDKPSAVTVRVSMPPLASKPSLRWKAIKGFAGLGAPYAGHATMQEASLDENLLHLANLRLAEIDRDYCGRAARRAAEPRARSGRHDVDHLMAAVYDHDLIFNNEEAVIAVLRKDVDQNRECRHGDDAHGRRNNGAGVDGEVHVIDVRRVSGRQH